MNRGKLITFEGGEGSGKSTQVNLLSKKLKDLGHEVVVTREPGGTRIGDKIREILLDSNNKKMDCKTEILLYAADRAQDIKENIKPALKTGKIVLADRYVDSNIIYQGYGRQLDVSWIKKINEWVIGEFWPDLTFFLNISAEKGLKRARDLSDNKDRLEEEVLEFHQRVRSGYIEVAEKEKRFVIIDADQAPEKINNRIIEIIKSRLL